MQNALKDDDICWITESEKLRLLTGVATENFRPGCIMIMADEVITD